MFGSLDRDPDVEAAWDAEIRRRVDDFEAGRIDTIPAETVFAEARRRLKTWAGPFGRPVQLWNLPRPGPILDFVTSRLSRSSAMSSPLRALEAAALLLPPPERQELAQRLLASLDSDPDVEAAWDKEIERRVVAFEAGLYEEFSAEEVLADARARLKA